MRRSALLFALLASPAFAQPGGAADAAVAKTVAPFIDEHTLVIVRIDIPRVDVDATMKLAAALVGVSEDSAELTRSLKAWAKRFAANGGKDIFLTYGAGDYPNLPCLIVPAPKEAAQARAIGDELSRAYSEIQPEATWAQLHGCVCIGSKSALAVLKDRKPVERPELIAALEAGREDVAQFVLALSAEAKKIHEQVSPILPAELGGGRVQKITRGVKWTSLSIGPAPKLRARLITEAASPQAAQDLKGLDLLTQQAILGQLLRSDGETDTAALKRMKGLSGASSISIEGSRITTEWDLATAIAESAKSTEPNAADRSRSANNMKQLMIAIHSYHDTYGRLPTDIRTAEGKPLLSWRVHLLPYIEHDHLYRQFRLNEPWDSEHNKKLIAQMPKIFRSPRQAAALKDQTTYLAPLGKGFIWDDPKGIKLSEISDGTSNTIALVETDDQRAVEWTKPQDISIEEKNPLAELLGHYGEGVHVSFADGSVRFVKKTINPKMFWAMLTRDGGEVISGLTPLLEVAACSVRLGTADLLLYIEPSARLTCPATWTRPL